MEQIVLQKTLNHEVEQYELACLQAKPEAVLEDHRIKCEVVLANFLDKKRELAELSRKWSLIQARRQT
jgi:hypothetical protein